MLLLFFSPNRSKTFLSFFQCQVRELEIQLEEERSQRSQAVSTKKQLEAELQEAETQVETAGRGKEETVKQLRRLQVRTYSHTYTLIFCTFQWPAFKIKKSLFLTGSNEGSSA